jgi:chorismate binding enzyme
VGWFAYDQVQKGELVEGPVDTWIAIRTLLARDGVAYLQAAGGIVYDSDEFEEWMEVTNRLGANLRCIELAERQFEGRIGGKTVDIMEEQKRDTKVFQVSFNVTLVESCITGRIRDTLLVVARYECHYHRALAVTQQSWRHQIKQRMGHLYTSFPFPDVAVGDFRLEMCLSENCVKKNQLLADSFSPLKRHLPPESCCNGPS